MFSYGIIIRWKHFKSFNIERDNNKIAIKYRIITTIIIQYTNKGWPHITQMLILERNTVPELCMVHHICIFVQIKTLCRLPRCHKIFSKNCLINPNSQTIEIKTVTIILKSFTSSKIWCSTISLRSNNKTIHSVSPLSSNNDLSTKWWHFSL